MQNAEAFGDNIASCLLKLFEAGYKKFHLIGFSLGALISGSIGRHVIRHSNRKYKIPRITGLDPGQIPRFLDGIVDNLNAGDAEFVDTIHGESKYFGSAESIGNASFWINSGISQPSCRSNLSIRKYFLNFSIISIKILVNDISVIAICSHLLTPKFYAESVSGENFELLIGVKCESYEDFIAERCEKIQSAFMGLYVDKNASGKYYLDVPPPRN